MNILDVVPLKTGMPKESLSYFTAQTVNVGDIVRIQIRRRIVPAIVLAIHKMEGEKMSIKSADFNLKKITEVVGPSPIPPEFFESIEEIKQYYLSSTGTLISNIIPTFMFDAYEKLSKSEKPKHAKTNLIPERLVYQANIDDRITYYKIYIRGTFAKKRSVIILLPTIHELESLYGALRKGIETYTISLHGGMSQKELILLYNQIIDETHPILILATPGFLAIPRDDIDTVIIERESSSAYKTIPKPNVDLRLFAELFAKKIGAKIILADGLLRPETVWRHKNHEFTEVAPLVARNENKLPYEIVDMQNKIETIGREKIVPLISDEVKNVISEIEKKSGHLILFSLKKGVASTTFCNDCKNIVACPKCKNPLILKSENRKKRVFLCQHCNEYFDTASTCVVCGSWNLVPIGIGTERVMEYITRVYPDLPVIRFDKDSIKNEGVAHKTLALFFKEKKAILVTTELALFYLDQKVDYTAIVSFDSLFTIPNFRIGEKIIGLVSSLASYTEKKFFIQTRNPDEKILQNIVSGNFSDWQRREIEMRKRFGYPPFTTIIKVSIVGSLEKVTKAHEYLNATFAKWNPDFLEHKVKVRGYETISMILKIPREQWYPKELLSDAIYTTELITALKELHPNWVITVDPYDLN